MEEIPEEKEEEIVKRVIKEARELQWFKDNPGPLAHLMEKEPVAWINQDE